MLSKPFVKFIVVGLIVLLLENLSVWLLMKIFDNFLVVRTISTLLAVVQSYVLNTRYSFLSTYSVTRFLSYLSGAVLSIGVTYFVSLSLYYIVFSTSYPLLATNVGAIAAAFTNFFYQRNVTFKRSD
jgi:putative flippase GtrA